LLSEKHENSKHQKPNFKQIPMTQIQNSKHDQPIFVQMVKLTAAQALRGDTD
jgi:hypothetical protein